MTMLLLGIPYLMPSNIFFSSFALLYHDKRKQFKNIFNRNSFKRWEWMVMVIGDGDDEYHVLNKYQLEKLESNQIYFLRYAIIHSLAYLRKTLTFYSITTPSWTTHLKWKTKNKKKLWYLTPYHLSYLTRTIN